MLRDRMTWQLYAVFSVWAFYLNALAPSISFLREVQNASATVAGLHGFGMGSGMFLAGVFGAACIRRWGRDRTLWGGTAVMASGAAVLLSAAPPWITLPTVVCATAGGAIAANVVMSAVAEHHQKHSAAAVSEANGIAAVAAVLAPAVLAVGVWGVGLWHTALLSVVVLSVAAFCVFRFLYAAPLHDNPHTRHSPISAQRLPRAYWSAWGAVIACCSIEFAFTIWVVDVLRNNTNTTPALAALAVSVTLIGLAVGRLLAARWADRVGLDTILYIGAAGVFCGFWIFWLSHEAVLAFSGVLLVGIGVAPMYPISVLRAARRAPHAADLAVQRTSLGTGPAVSFGPLLIGVLADAVQVQFAVLVVPACAVVAAGMVYLSRRRTDRAVPREVTGSEGESSQRGGTSHASADADHYSEAAHQ